VFQRNYGMLLESGSDRNRKIAIIVVSIIAAIISWRFIEQPFREGKHRPAPSKLAWMAAVASAIVLVIGACMWKADGVPSRFSAQAIEYASYLNYQAGPMFRDEACFLSARVGRTDVNPECVVTATDKPNYLIIGDSHAAQLWSGLSAAMPDKNFMQITAAGCLPTITPKFNESIRCREVFSKLFASLTEDKRATRLIITGRWTEESLPGVAATLDWAKQNKIVVTLLGPIAIYDSPLPRLLVTGLKRNQQGYADQHWDMSLVQLDQRMAQLAHEKGTEYVSMINLLCEGNKCLTLDDQQHPLIFDREHYTERGSYVVAQRMRQLL
jgi:hypothetical protein